MFSRRGVIHHTKSSVNSIKSLHQKDFETDNKDNEDYEVGDYKQCFSLYVVELVEVNQHKTLLSQMTDIFKIRGRQLKVSNAS